MFHLISDAMCARMQYLEKIDRLDRTDGTPKGRRLRQITPDTGRFLAIMAASAPPGMIVELGTSAGYSTLWLSLAAKLRNQKLVTFEMDPLKAEIARETFEVAHVTAFVELKVGDARTGLGTLDQIGFCFMDLEKEHYQECFDLLLPRLLPGGLLIADNVISHQQSLTPFVSNCLQDPSVDAVVVPIGKGELVCRKNDTSSST